MALSKEQVERIAAIIRDRHLEFVINTLGPDAVTMEELKKLKDSGYISADPTQLHFDSYLMGRVVAKLKEGQAKHWTFQELQRHLFANPIPMRATELKAAEHAARRGAVYVRGLADEMVKNVSAKLTEESEKIRRTLPQQVIAEEVEQAIRNRTTARALASDLFHAIDDKGRDFQRVAHTELQNAYSIGAADEIQEQHGDEARVYKRPNPDACAYCVKLYLKKDGVTPRIFRMSEITSNGTNVGRKAADWKPVIGATHPYCECTLMHMPNGFGFDSSGDIIAMKSDAGEQYESAEFTLSRVCRGELEFTHDERGIHDCC